MLQYYSEEQTNSLIKKLNATYNQFSHWEKRKAKKVHKDVFGEIINDGELYYRIRIDNNLSNDLKLTTLSMDRFLFTLFAPMPLWEKQSEQIITDKQLLLRNIIDNLRK